MKLAVIALAGSGLALAAWLWFESNRDPNLEVSASSGKSVTSPAVDGTALTAHDQGHRQAHNRDEATSSGDDWAAEAREALAGGGTSATQFLLRGGLEHVDDELGFEICRATAGVGLASIGEAGQAKIVEDALSRGSARKRMKSLVESGYYPGFSQETLDSIEESFSPQLRQAAVNYAASLEEAIDTAWESRSEFTNPDDGLPNSGLPKREAKPLFQRITSVGPHRFRLQIYAEDHPVLAANKAYVKDIEGLIWAEQMAYLEPLKKD